MSQTPSNINFIDQVETEPDLQSSIASESKESSGISSIGINFPSLAFQVINFIILFLLLRKFLFAPVAKMLETRKKAIEESLANASAVQKQKQDFEVKQKRMFDEAVARSTKVIDEAKKQAENLRKESVEKTRKEQAEMIAGAKLEIGAEGKRQLAQVKKEMLSIVTLAVDKVAKKLVTDQKDNEVIKEVVKEIRED